ncbi:MAG: IS1595 family transposase [Thermodesulfobacteriota bacterium]|jgi:transposase-like protein
MEVSLISLIKRYSDDNKCRDYLKALKWQDGVKCPRCGSEKISKIEKRHQFDCDECRYQFSVTAGSIFHDSHLPLWKWFLAVYLMTESKKGISANQLKRSLEISYKTAWYLCHRIRKAMQEAGSLPKLKGVVEVDETYVGGRYDRRRKREPWDKQAVVGLLQRNGRFEAKAVSTPSKKILVGVIKDRVDKRATVMTDELRAYKSLDKEFKHESVNHRAEEWARGNVYTNGVENAWSLFKRSIVGSYHQISMKHLDAYLDEFDWRFNGRDNPYLFRDTLLRLLNSTQIEFKKLVSKPERYN